MSENWSWRDKGSEEKDSNLDNVMCPLPWSHLSTNTDGTVRVCCGGAEIDDKHGKTNTLFEIFNSSMYKSVRKKMLSGIKPSECNYCWYNESRKVTSFRQHLLKWGIKDQGDSQKIIKLAQEKTKEDGGVSLKNFPVQYYDLRLDNKCTEKCRTCGPAASNLWYDDYVNLVDNFNFTNEDVQFGSELRHHAQKINITVEDNIPVNKEDYLKIYPKKSWSEKKFLPQVLKTSKKITKLHFAGGEPFINNEHKLILESCIESGSAKNISLSYNTNLTVIPKYLWEVWTKFYQVSVITSIDAIENRFEYIRHPGKWKTVLNNMYKLDKFKPEKSKFGAQISCVVSIFNIIHFLNLQEFIIKEFSGSFDRLIIGQPLYSPRYFDCRMLPARAKDKITSKYEYWIRKNKPNSEIKDQLLKIVNWLNSEDTSDQIDIFYKNTYALDKIRNENFSVTFYEIDKLLKL